MVPASLALFEWISTNGGNQLSVVHLSVLSRSGRETKFESPNSARQKIPAPTSIPAQAELKKWKCQCQLVGSGQLSVLSSEGIQSLRPTRRSAFNSCWILSSPGQNRRSKRLRRYSFSRRRARHALGRAR